jgi:hypothetical protein
MANLGIFNIMNYGAIGDGVSPPLHVGWDPALSAEKYPVFT